MKILVCITHVPDTTSKIQFTDNNTQLDKSGVQFIIGPYDDYALARAVELKAESNGSITVLNVGEAETEPTLRKALAIGADEAVRINAFPKDAFFVAKQIANFSKDKGFDLILMGRESIDFNGGMVHGMVGELLGMPSLSPVMKLEVEGGKGKLSREIEGGKEFIEVDLPFIAGCQEPIAEWKIPNMRGIMSARTKPLTVSEPVGDESRTAVNSYEMPPAKGAVKLVDNVDQLVDLLKNDAKIL
ncbi:electron transfer flavoprotein subunit beta/FixA family protein [Cyclobacterium amurskyense]|uniref:Electron transfer flavoprotein subunit beta n=1 Tax=Cyclobacterium amurskyense TaxID=320787 RepID=A0A0H4P6F1_9BACT|nr:electron transfer flavoprotein subunit beta/FixA family protein [Cyclobacterium amurskyense]AKP49709.1 Electron transfer flavoprotein, beta subunit [Cyclobacterium amurskyense]|tara:strand:- start:13003 stop:13734 length:732 start_codon:yes stop_codon:yes gene_type:complete